jgi:FixJ family two-component response regulator
MAAAGKHQGALLVVVDDDAAVRSSLKFSFELEGFDVRTFAGAKELFDEPDFSAFSCVIVDQNMPGMTGLALISELRARKVMVPAILITSHPSDIISQQATKAGVPIVEKPFLGNTLFRQVLSAVERN